MSAPSPAPSRPPPRVVWVSPGGQYRIAARDRADGPPAGYGVQARTAKGWDWDTAGYPHDEAVRLLFARLDEGCVVDRLRDERAW